MSSWQGRYFDGRSAAAKTVEVRVEQGHLLIEGEGVAVSCRAAQVTSMAPVGAMPWRFSLPDGGALEIPDAALLARRLGHGHDWAGRLERSGKLALAAVPLIVGFLFAGYQWGLPWLADRGAEMVPPSLEHKLADETLKMLDNYGLTKTKLPAERQAALRSRFAELTRGGNPEYKYRLEFRDAKEIGPNAFALPGGVIVMTDQLATMKTVDDDQLLAVLAHEMGHVELRHGIRGLLRSSGLGVAVSVALGDATSIGTTLAALPVMLADLQYSRNFENEADDYALALLPKRDISPCAFATVMSGIEAEMKKSDKDENEDKPSKVAAKKADGRDKQESHESEESSIPSWLSTHPDTKERTLRFAAFCVKPAAAK